MNHSLFSLLLLLHVSFIDGESNIANIKSKMDKLRGFDAKPLPGGSVEVAAADGGAIPGGLHIKRLGNKFVLGFTGLEATTAAGGATAADTTPAPADTTPAPADTTPAPAVTSTAAAGGDTTAGPAVTSGDTTPAAAVASTAAAGGDTTAGPAVASTAAQPATVASTAAAAGATTAAAAGATTAAAGSEGPYDPYVDCVTAGIDTTCASIAGMFSMSVETLMANNPAIDCSALSEGDRICYNARPDAVVGPGAP